MLPGRRSCPIPTFRRDGSRSRVTASPLSVYTLDRSVFACSKAVAAIGLYWSLIANSDIALSTNSGFSWFIFLSVAATFPGSRATPKLWSPHIFHLLRQCQRCRVVLCQRPGDRFSLL